jgi:hypothetical protein
MKPSTSFLAMGLVEWYFSLLISPSKGKFHFSGAFPQLLLKI